MNQISKLEPLPDDGGAVTTPWREWLRTILPIVLLASALLAGAWMLIEPAPPKRVVIATAPEGASYNDFAAEYAKYFAEHGVTLEIRKTAGSRENYGLLSDPNQHVDAALVQGGTAPPADQVPGIESVCTVTFEPMFLLYRADAFKEPVTRLEQLKGKRVAVGGPASGTYWVSTPMLALHGIGDGPEGKVTRELAVPATKPTTAQVKAFKQEFAAKEGVPVDQVGYSAVSSTQLVPIGGVDSARKLMAGDVDAAFYCVSLGTAYLHDALRSPGIKLASLKLVPAYANKFDFLTTVTLHEGTLDIARDMPDHDVAMVAPTTALIARKGTHKAIVQLLVQAAQKVHGRRDPLAPPGAFPSLDYAQLPVGGDARYFFSAKPGFLQRTLPFWLASLIDRMLILLVPLAVILIPLIRMAPRIYQWRMRARVYRWYKRLRHLDGRLLQPLTPAERTTDQAALDQLDREISREVKVPLGYMDAFYTLRVHVAYLKERFASANVGGVEAAGNP
jgi:TRAP-type uncharacterized transport system substrate-binding protein